MKNRVYDNKRGLRQLRLLRDLSVTKLRGAGSTRNNFRTIYKVQRGDIAGQMRSVKYA